MEKIQMTILKICNTGIEELPDLAHSRVVY
jgi:hypothetical protein